MHRVSFWQLVELRTKFGLVKYWDQPEREAGGAAGRGAAAKGIAPRGPAPIERPPKPIYQQVFLSCVEVQPY